MGSFASAPWRWWKCLWCRLGRTGVTRFIRDRRRAADAALTRPRRRLAVVSLALVIAAGVLSVGSGPVQAAAADVQTDRLRGATRYETAVEIAEAFVDEIEGGSFGGEVDTVILI